MLTQKKKTLRFDVVLSFDINREDALKILRNDFEKLYPDYEIQIVPDLDL